MQPFPVRAWAALYVAALLLPWTLAQNVSVISLENAPNNTLEATAWALVYALPLIQLVNQTSAVYRIVGGANRINFQDQLASLSSAAVVKPNVDTLYGRVIVDLSQTDLELTVPNITDRFWIYPFYDAFGNNYANISPVNGSRSGVYLVRRSDDAAVAPGLQTTVPANYSKYQGIVNAPTTYGTILIRLLLKYNTTENINSVRRIQNATRLVPVPRTIQQPETLKVSEFNGALINNSLTGTPPEQLLQLLSRIASSNQPEVASERFRTANILGQAGLVGGTYQRPSGVNTTLAYAIANATINKYINDTRLIQQLGNGWRLSPPAYNGDFGANYAHRAYIARTGYQQLVPYIVQYPGYESASFTNFVLPANRSFLWTFSRKPPVRTALGGFWSLTFYGANEYLIPNSLDRFSVGDRSNITYLNGQVIYPVGSTNSADEPFKILIQQADIRPPANWTSNWLPSPAGGGSGSFILRWYVPSNDFTNGTYVFPKVEQIAAIR
ncbi:MAG: hypothetical protein M1814_001393 [Vezdaea aestivalis]|nr:MAG: hypothetical protein M1814_001393 [Vezdaea aestivalis]